MRLPDSAHSSQPWRIHAIAEGFRLEDVWRLPVRTDDLPELVRQFAAFGTGESSSRAVRWLFALRWKLGELFGWDAPSEGLGERMESLRGRVPEDLHERGPKPELPFEPLYLTDDEWAAEIANDTMHGVMHLGRLPDGTVQMAVLVRPNGLLGQVYMAAIKPFRLLLVYPALMRDVERRWQTARA